MSHERTTSTSTTSSSSAPRYRLLLVLAVKSYLSFATPQGPLNMGGKTSVTPHGGAC